MANNRWFLIILSVASILAAANLIPAESLGFLQSWSSSPNGE